VGEDTGVDVPPIRSARLDLVSLSPAAIEAVLAGRLGEAERQLGFRLPDGFPGDDLERILRLRLGQMQQDPDSQRWLVRGLVLRESGTMVGHAGFHGPPGTTGLDDPAKVEIGYSVFPAFRGRGYATEAAAALMDWAEGEGIHRFVFSIGPWNEPSLAIARKLGFVQTGEHWDEQDGLEHVFELDRQA
jgi:[ribosomal protein S5]-alanine N-acetyltransferase